MTVGILEIKTGKLMNEAENLIARVKRGDEAAFRVIFERHQRLVLRFLYSMVGRRDIAEELAQEAFLGAYKNIHTLRDESKLATWLCGIAKNVAYNWLRTADVRSQKVEIDSEFVGEFRSETPPPDSKILRDELNQVIHNALLQLDNDKRTVFTLKMLQQLSYEEITEITGFSIPKLKSDLHRAKAEMRRLISPYMEKSDEM